MQVLALQESALACLTRLLGAADRSVVLQLQCSYFCNPREPILMLRCVTHGSLTGCMQVLALQESALACLTRLLGAADRSVVLQLQASLVAQHGCAGLPLIVEGVHTALGCVRPECLHANSASCSLVQSVCLTDAGVLPQI